MYFSKTNVPTFGIGYWSIPMILVSFDRELSLVSEIHRSYGDLNSTRFYSTFKLRPSN